MPEPRCRNCGEKIAKLTTRIYFGREADKDRFIISRKAKPINREEAQKLVCGVITTVKQSNKYETEANGGRKYIASANIWDGRSYEDDLFCKIRCAADFGRKMARNGYHTASYNEAQSEN